MTKEGFIKSAEAFAIQAHDIDANQKYDKRPYSVHLRHVYSVGLMFQHQLPEAARTEVLAACWLHDTIEDARVTYGEIRNRFDYTVAEIVYAVTNEKGRTRKDRANGAYYKGIRETEFASFVKMCDRIANVEYSKQGNDRLMAMYQKENEEFLFEMCLPDDNEMVVYLRSLFADEPRLSSDVF
jgi:(p)ppGpp synthase/HD superfamily hydrolase